MKRFAVNSHRGHSILGATILAAGAAFLQGTAVNIALPAIQEHFDTNLAGIQWVLNAYIMVLAAFILIGGSLSDRLGRKKVYLAGILIFTGGALLSAFSQELYQLISFQALQGLGAALLFPGSLAIINGCFFNRQQGRAFGVWAGLSGGIAALGPLLGGWLIETISWRAVFALSGLIGLLALWLTLRVVPETYNKTIGRPDWLGATLTLPALFGVSFGLIQGPSWGWDNPWVISALLIGIASIISFIVAEKHAENPILPLQMFHNRLVAGADLATFFLYFALTGTTFLLALNLQQVYEFSPTNAGLALLPLTGLIALLSGPAGTLTDKIGNRLPMIVGPLMVAFGAGMLTLPGLQASYLTHFLPALILFGSGMALSIPALTGSALKVKAKFAGAASGVNSEASRIAGLIAVAVLGAVMASFFAVHLDNTLRSTQLEPAAAQKISAQSNEIGGIKVPENLPPSQKQAAEIAIKESAVFAFRRAIGLCSVLAFLAAGFNFLATRNPQIAYNNP